MGSREDRLLQEKLQRMADLGVEPAPLPPASAVPAWSPDDIVDAEPADEIAGGDVGASPDTSEESPTREDGPSSPAMPACEVPNEGHYIGLRNGSQPGPDGWKPAVTPAEERMIFGAPVNRTVAEVEGTHGSPELDADAEKLIAMGQDPGPTLDELDPSFEADFAEVEEAAPVPVLDEADICRLVHEAEGTAAPAWAVGDLCIYEDQLAEVVAVSLCHVDLDVWQVALKKGGYEWSARGRFGIPDCDLSEIDADSDAGTDRFYVDALHQHKAALAAESTARQAHDASDRLLRAHYALAEAAGALALVGKALKVADSATA